MKDKLRIVLAQLNFTVGDISGNLEKHLRAAAKARDELAADLILFPELSITGYSPEDLLLRKSFIQDANAAVNKLQQEISDIHCVIGHPYADDQHLHNACSLIYNQHLIGRYTKQSLPTYGVFDEARYFTPGTASCVLPVHGISTGLLICEDLWKIDPTHNATKQGARLILSPNASPFEINKYEQRLSVLTKRATHENVTILYTNHVGGQDDIVYDGGSLAIDSQGEIKCAGFFNECLHPIDIDKDTLHITGTNASPPNQLERIYQALVLGVRDYINKNAIRGVIIGVSGGIDSALTLAIAVDALGKAHVRAVYMPSRYSAQISHEDAAAVTSALGVKLEVISIEATYQSFLNTLAPSFAGKKPDVTEENIQARCRAIILMALSNQSGYLVLNTSNRSESAVGYCTLYGDMAGGFSALKDVPKTLVYELAHYRNQIQPVIPQRTIDRPPTAELAANQKDEDSLPPYAVLDRILDSYLNHGLGVAEIIALGFDAETVTKVINLIQHSEYKRKQGPIGTHINHKSFIRDWRYPLTNRFKG